MEGHEGTGAVCRIGVGNMVDGGREVFGVLLVTAARSTGSALQSW